jgi:hypothetical protein
VRGAAPYTVPLLAALALLWQGCRVRDLTEGPYDFTASSVERDDCLLNPAAGPLPSADLTSTGNWIYLQYDWFGMQLAGRYRDQGFFDDGPEQFFVDGSAQNVSADVGGVHCTLDAATAHLEGTTLSDTRFTGTLRFRYEARQPDECYCETWVTFQALHR